MREKIMLKMVPVIQFIIPAALVVVLVTSCAPIGGKMNPIECSGVEGELEYLNRLQGPDSLPVKYERVGSVLGQRAGYVMYDEYKVESQDGIIKKTIFMNMHAGGFPDKPIEGFYLKPDTTMTE
jgi:hypothetical protein